MELIHFQQYWWLIISVLGAILVFLLFVQGGQTMFLDTKDVTARQMMVNSIGRKWELTFTTLVTFGGAFFASFPLFYSTSFGGAYWLWMLILLSFIIQAISYEFRRKPGNIFGTRFYDTLLFFNGSIGCILLGVAVGTMFFGGEFTIVKTNILDPGAPVISQWAGSHGLEAIADWRNLLLGLVVLFLARMQAGFYFINNLSDDDDVISRARRETIINGGIFVVLFLVFIAVLFTTTGYTYDPETGVITADTYRYLFNLIEMWWFGALFLIGVVMVLFALFRTLLKPDWKGGIWFSGIGTVLVILSLFAALGYNNTAYLPSTTDIQSSLTIVNSSSTLFTLKTMTIVSVLVPFVIAYIAYVWRKMDATPITPDEVKTDDHLY
ncbi:MAG: cytochrome d ubiquinol oxidase subunit II [Muribaculaceae bacterium]|nr:cytochrome d ubiquinol oxidase subunit II [Muribaculaceae bacterium]